MVALGKAAGTNRVRPLTMSNDASSAQEILRRMHECFDEIAAQHGMKCVAEIAGYTVTYENELTRLTVSYDSRRSREVYILIGAIQTHSGPHPHPFDQA
jgi:hypothetical protein